MRRAAFLAVLLAAASFASAAAEVRLPIGKGTVRPFVLDLPDGWTAVPGRARGDRWLLRETAGGRQVARIDYKLASTDQKMLRIVVEQRLRLGEVDVDKVSVAMGPYADDEPPRVGRATPLVTSYRVAGGPLEGLFVMTETYTRSSGLEAKIERMLSTVRVR